MFDQYEELSCHTCGFTFFGRRPQREKDILCSDCLEKDELPLVDVNDDIPTEVTKMFKGARGEN